MTRCWSVVCLGLLLAGCASRPTSVEELTKLAQRIQQAKHHIDSIWPKYQPSQRNFVLHNGAGNGLLLHDDRIEPVEFYPEPSAISYIRHHKLSNGAEATVIEVSPGRHRSAVRTLIHEDFHSWQAENFKAGDLIDADNLAVGAELYQLKLAELDVLSQLLDDLAATDQLQLYTAYRKYRESIASTSLNLLELQYERIEGSANYVGIEAAKAILDTGDADKRSTISFLRQRLPENNSNTTYLRTYSYAVGAALAWWLDTTGENWKPKVSNGASMFELISPAADIKPKKATVNRKSSNTRKSLSYSAFENQAKWILRVAANGGEYRSANLHQISSDKIMLAPAQALSLNQEGLALTARNVWVWLDYSRNEIEVTLAKPLVLDSCQRKASDSQWYCTDLSFSGGGVAIELRDRCIDKTHHQFTIRECGVSTH